MPISTDSSINFSSATGYVKYEGTAGDIVFTGGVCRLKIPFTGSAAVRTPQIDTSGFTSLQSSVPLITGDVGYQHRFLVCFDDLTTTGFKTFQAWLPGAGWYGVARSDFATTDLIDAVAANGMLLCDLQAVREWPVVEAGTHISFIVGMTRESGGGTGASITQIDVSYGSEIVNIIPTETSIGTLPFEPNQPVSLDNKQFYDSLLFSGGYTQNIENATEFRRFGQLTFGPLDDADIVTLNDFLELGKATHFDWQLIYDVASSKWKVLGQQNFSQAGVKGLNNCTCQIVEYFP